MENATGFHKLRHIASLPLEAGLLPEPKQYSSVCFFGGKDIVGKVLGVAAVTLPETNIALKIGLPDRKVVFQPSIFRGENVSFREGRFFP